MNLFGMPPLLGGGRDGLKIGSVGLLLIVTEVQVVLYRLKPLFLMGGQSNFWKIFEAAGIKFWYFGSLRKTLTAFQTLKKRFCDSVMLWKTMNTSACTISQGPSGQDTDPVPAINYLKYKGVRQTQHKQTQHEQTKFDKTKSEPTKCEQLKYE